VSQQKVLVLVGDAAEELDAMYPIYRLREAGYIADVAALTRRDVQLVIHASTPSRTPTPRSTAASCRSTSRSPRSTRPNTWRW
jgi:putative intracellular protease/amidase